MEMSQQGGAEAESLLRPDHKNAVLMPHGHRGWDLEGEKAPFLRNEPVKLTPAWEGTNLPNDTLNLKGIAMDLAPPKDRWNLIYLTLIIHGLGTLTAWNMFITAKDYFVDYKLVDAKNYAEHYLAYVGWASQIPNVVFNWMNIFVQFGGNLTTRIVWSLCIEVAIFVFTIILAMLDSKEWPEVFFWLTMLSVLLLNAFNAIFQNSVYGVAARLPPKYTGAVVLGSNICGTLVVFLSWSSGLFESKRTAAIYYFIAGMFVLLICFDTYFALPLNRFYRYHNTLQQRTLRVNPALAATNNEARPDPRPGQPYGTILRQAWVQIYNIFIVFFVTLAIFPSVHSDIKPVSMDLLGDNFTMITCFLTFNLMAMIGNITASLWQFPTRRWLAVFTTLRLLFIPFFLACNYKADVRTIPVLVTNDWVYWIGSALMGWSSGHGSSLGMMYVSGNVAPEHAATAGMLGAATLVTGILCGLLFTRLCPIIVSIPWDAI
ncbi:equilibrative nucleoside transporter 1 [Galleria mellonella]|uniref:Equilibrative nucleoside transporter 1 n=1 Tax=Galleria mellonella TaxID=7137 RepID=A0ABM3MJE5_GALME|nr:equilibrative nucleoside transporter 1 [Galleria mellonella]XP_052751244.1 equilibrative nucleoside transporter 1 [Galleria mellonella]XP_052751245.1 equilibrative nucleoside transporter 1 [Galleria mellonella]